MSTIRYRPSRSFQCVSCVLTFTSTGSRPSCRQCGKTATVRTISKAYRQ